MYTGVGGAGGATSTGEAGTEGATLPVLGPDELLRRVPDDRALEAAEEAFRLLARGEAVQPDPVGFEMLEADGEVHVKAAGAPGAGLFTVKVATVFKAAEAAGLPAMSGLVLAFDAASGQPRALLLDHSRLTDLRTAAAGALALRLLAPGTFSTLLVVGTGVQARLQPRLMARVRRWSRTLVWGRDPGKAEACARDVAADLERAWGEPGGEVRPVDDLAGAAGEAEVVVTVTAARSPLLGAAWLREGFTVVAVGSDGPRKQELEPGVLARADKVLTDRTAQCVRLGELHHAVEAGLLTPDDVHAELGEVLVGRRPGREGDESIVCDLTGVGIQDTTIARAALEGGPEEG